MDKERKKNLLKLGGALLIGIIGHELADEFLNGGDSDDNNDDLLNDELISSDYDMLGDFDSVPEPNIDIDNSELDDLDNDGQYNPTFGRSPSSIEHDIDYYEGKLKDAQDNVKYYSKKLSSTNISSVYRRDCEFSLKMAVKDVETYTKKIASLIKELNDAV